MLVRGRISVLVVAMVCAVLSAQAPSAGQSTATVTISGTSTVRNWSCPAEAAVKVTAGKPGAAAPGFPDGVQSVAFTVPIKAIECDNDTMNEHLRTALKEKAYPQIAYRMSKYAMAGSGAATVTGQLTIAGVTRPVTFDVKLTPSANGLRSQGETNIDMTQYGVTPPKVLLGQLIVGRMVRVKFDAMLQPAP
ncbi:MAG: YceI family protein [Acidobacteria bacterium]|nr:YceI family protein [Acidobacteriota bacterium]